MTGVLFGTLIICLGFSSLISYRLAPRFIAVGFGYLKLFILVAIASLLFCFSLLFFAHLLEIGQLPEKDQNLRYYLFASWALMTWTSFLLVPFVALASGWFLSQALIMKEVIE